MKVVVYENEKVVNTFEGNDIYVACGRQLFVTYDIINQHRHLLCVV